MPLEKLSRAEIESLRSGGSREADPEYVRFMRTMKPGDIGRGSIKAERVTKQSLKNRLNKAAAAAGVKIKFLRSRRGGDPDIVMFELDTGA